MQKSKLPAIIRSINQNVKKTTTATTK